MIRLISIATISVSLLLWSVQGFSDSPESEHPEVEDNTTVYCPSTPRPCPTTQQPQTQQHRHYQKPQQHYWSCPIPGHKHPIGTPCPVVGHFMGDSEVGQRFGLGSAGATFGGFKMPKWPSFKPSDEYGALKSGAGAGGASGLGGGAGLGDGSGFGAGLASRFSITPQVQSARPAGPPPGGVFEGFFARQPYQRPGVGQQLQPVHGQHVGTADMGGMPGFQSGDGHLITHPGHIPERIVYVPYAMPPPVYVERLGQALPRLTVRRMLGDANMYEYPEMPHEMYTTRGPRDFLAPNPPSIGY